MIGRMREIEGRKALGPAGSFRARELVSAQSRRQHQPPPKGYLNVQGSGQVPATLRRGEP